jgi:LruC domain-containing protein
MKNIIVLMCLCFFSLSAGQGCSSRDNETLTPSDIADLVVPNRFNYSMTSDVSVQLTVLTNTDEPVPGIDFQIYSARPQDGGEYLGAGITDDAGIFKTLLPLPTSLESIVAVGYMATTEIHVKMGLAQYLYGGSAPSGLFGQASGAAPVRTATEVLFEDRSPVSIQAINPSYEYLQPYNSQGVPQNLLHDAMPADFLLRISTTLPEQRALPVSHPDYINDSNQLNIKIDALADIWVTFVAEGAGYLNSLGFFTYPVGQPPATVNDITTMKIIFPNASLSGSGGGLHAGDKLYLGRYPAGTMIGWFMVSNGWNGGAVGTGYGRYFSLPNLNPESSTSLRQHSILVWDGQFQKLMFAFEDINRSSGGCDQDFNDVIFYATATPVEAVDMAAVQPMDQPTDTDGDGVSDIFDDYPTDSTRAFDNYVPSQNQYGTLAFEDLWPAQGDYDFNDVVLGYKINQVTNAKGNVVQIQGSIMIRAIGASYANGFGIEFPFAASKIARITGSHDPVVEPSGSEKAVVILIDNVFDFFPRESSVYINTLPDVLYLAPAEITFTLDLTEPLSTSTFNYQPPYNPFIYQNRVRSHEIHLPGYAPTIGADQTLFGTGDDSSVPAKGRYYKTGANLPWALNVPVLWDYPIERDQITWGYTAFKNWAQSSGIFYQDWYMNNTNYRSNEFIYYQK